MLVNDFNVLTFNIAM